MGAYQIWERSVGIKGNSPCRYVFLYCKWNGLGQSWVADGNLDEFNLWHFSFSRAPHRETASRFCDNIYPLHYYSPQEKSTHYQWNSPGDVYFRHVTGFYDQTAVIDFSFHCPFFTNFSSIFGKECKYTLDPAFVDDFMGEQSWRIYNRRGHVWCCCGLRVSVLPFKKKR